MKGLALKTLQCALQEWPEGVRELLEGGCEEIGSELIDTAQVWVKSVISTQSVTSCELLVCRFVICLAAPRGPSRLSLRLCWRPHQLVRLLHL